MTPEIYEFDDRFSTDLAAEWEAFVVSAGGSFFQTPTWVASWWATVGQKPSTEVRFWRDSSGKLTTVALRSRVSERIHARVPIPIGYCTNTGTGVGGADNAGWCVNGPTPPGLIDWAARSSAWRPTLLQNIAADSAEGLNGKVLRRTLCPRLDIRAFREASVGSSKLRKQIRYNRTRLTAEGVALLWHPPGSVTPELLERLVSLHGERREMKGDSTTFTTERLALHESLASKSSQIVGTAAVEASRDGKSVAILYGLVCGSTFSYYQSGWDPSLAKHSIGSVLISESISLAGDQGAQVYDFLRGPEPYKYRFGAVDRTDVDILIGRGPMYRILAYKRELQEARRS